MDKLSKLLQKSEAHAHIVPHDDLEIGKGWISSSQEKILYNKITARIEEALERLVWESSEFRCYQCEDEVSSTDVLLHYA